MGRASQRRLVQYASRQFGLVTAADVAKCRVSRGWMQRRMETGEWSRIYRGVFRLGAHPSLDAREMAMQPAEKVGVRPKLHLEIVENGQLIAEADLSWPEVRLCVQLDGWRYHRSREAFVRDRARDRALDRLGWTVLRYTWQDVEGSRKR